MIPELDWDQHSNTRCSSANRPNSVHDVLLPIHPLQDGVRPVPVHGHVVPLGPRVANVLAYAGRNALENIKQSLNLRKYESFISTVTGRYR